MSLIDELWYGNVLPTEHCGRNNAMLKKHFHFMLKNKEILDSKLNTEQLQLLNAYTEESDEYTQLLSLEAFREGFSLAIKLLCEAFANDAYKD
ncbi:MAG: hypothetical protein E7453_08590 [Ruminococcaceae bacterium]|nr:hypothetical protein [Oscillospiraceae bacterium]